MAKAKKSKTGKSSGKAGGKLPKTIAGVELPKELRKQGGKLLDLIKNPLVGDLVAAGLVALAANVRGVSKPASEETDDKPRSSDAISKTAVTLATVVAARAAEKITSKLTERPAPVAEPEASATPPAPAARTVTRPVPDSATAKPSTTRRRPGPKPGTPRKPRMPKPTD